MDKPYAVQLDVEGTTVIASCVCLFVLLACILPPTPRPVFLPPGNGGGAQRRGLLFFGRGPRGCGGVRGHQAARRMLVELHHGEP